MKAKCVVAALVMMSAALAVGAQKAVDIPNPAIDMKGYLQIAGEAAEYREKHRLTEDEFIKMSKESGVIVLDAQSKQKYDELHVSGAVNLSFPDVTVEPRMEMAFINKPLDHHIYSR